MWPIFSGACIRWSAQSFFPPVLFSDLECRPRDVKISPSLQLISSLMGLASKCIMDSLRRELVDELLQIFPTSLSQYRSSPAPDNPILGIDIGVKYEIPAIIPAACYRGALLGSQQIIDGFRLPDGTSTVSTVSRALCTRLRERLVLWIKGDAYDDDDHRRPSYLPTQPRLLIGDAVIVARMLRWDIRELQYRKGWRRLGVPILRPRI
ncbi:hypothetical protein OF83DRAFT_1137806 [Amylostereum chailletii]|nr:hypothetical protein OF83DRAFT_1137806 [Amylostereum chailletii]